MGFRKMNEEVETEYGGLKIHAASNLHKSCLSVIDKLALPSQAKALDLGAGEGAFTQRLLERGYNVAAVELDPARFKLDAAHCSLDLNLDFSDKLAHQFDLIVAIEIVEHL